jgi:hypothetical protein
MHLPVSGVYDIISLVALARSRCSADEVVMNVCREGGEQNGTINS